MMVTLYMTNLQLTVFSKNGNLFSTQVLSGGFQHTCVATVRHAMACHGYTLFFNIMYTALLKGFSHIHSNFKNVKTIVFIL